MKVSGVGGGHLITPLTTESPCSNLGTPSHLCAWKEVSPKVLRLKHHSRQLHEIHPQTIICILRLSPLYMLQKRLDVNFKQHKCLSTKQSSSESCGTQSSFFFVRITFHSLRMFFPFLGFRTSSKEKNPLKVKFKKVNDVKKWVLFSSFPACFLSLFFRLIIEKVASNYWESSNVKLSWLKLIPVDFPCSQFCIIFNFIKEK